MDEMKLRARAKINLALDVLGVRDNGYHEVKMIMQSLALYDEIILRKTMQPGIVLESNYRYIPTNEMNHAYRAAKMLIDEFQIPYGVYIYLNKRIPAAAGLAGGSSDAATVLFGMNAMFSLGLSREELMDRGLKIGADVPFCIMRGTVLARGIGECLTKLPAAPHFHVLLVKPAFGVSTKRVYEMVDSMKQIYHPNVDEMVDYLCYGMRDAFLKNRPLNEMDCQIIPPLLGNSLEKVTVSMHPVIEQIRQDILAQGALGACMSGSGPTVFGLFETKQQCLKAYEAMRQQNNMGQIYYTEFYDPAQDAMNRNQRDRRNAE